MLLGDSVLDRMEAEGPNGRKAVEVLERLHVEDSSAYWSLCELIRSLYERGDQHLDSAIHLLAQREGVAPMPPPLEDGDLGHDGEPLDAAAA